MKMVTAYIQRTHFEPIREELLELGFVSISVMDASGSFPEPEAAGSYRGVAIERHVRPKARLECIVGDDQVATVVETVLKHGDRTFAFVVPVEAAYPEARVNQGEVVPAG
jgi:nitrogen regulatory protein PII